MADSPHQAVVIGLNQTKKALLAERADLLYVADNADERLIQQQYFFRWRRKEVLLLNMYRQ